MSMKQHHCCLVMEASLQDDRIPIRYLSLFREYSFLMLYHTEVSPITYCPWCCSKLPLPLREQYFITLKDEFHLDDMCLFLITSENEELPQEFLSDQWWIARGL